MKLSEIFVINIAWKKIVYDEKEIKKYSNSTDAGLYQIYGSHPAYGTDALLYIGKASSFAERL